MAKVLYHITMSLDGFVAGPADDMTWLAGLHAGPHPVVERVVGGIGAIVMGHNTYAPATTAEGKVYGGHWDGPIFVVTRSAAPSPGFTLVEELGEAVRAASAAGTSRCWAPRRPGAASKPACWTRYWSTWHRSCSATASGCSTTRAGRGCGLSLSR